MAREVCVRHGPFFVHTAQEYGSGSEEYTVV